MNFDEWAQFGYEQGWIGPPVCYTHDGMPMSSAELYAFEEGEDPCMHMIRLYEDDIQKGQIEDEHSPSQWRATNAGMDKTDYKSLARDLNDI